MRDVSLLALGASAVAAIVVAIGAPSLAPTLAAALAGAFVIAAIGRFLGDACAANRLDLFSPIIAFPCLYLVWFGIASVPLLRDLNPPRELTPIATQWPIYVLGIAAWLGGVWVAGRILGAAPVGGEHRPAERFDRRKLFRACAIVFAVAVAATAMIFARRGVPLFAAKGDAARLQVATSGWERLLLTGFDTVAILVIAHAARERFRVEPRFWVLLLLSIGVLVTTADRALVVMPIACGVVLAHYLWRMLRPAHLVVVLVPVALFLSATVILRGTRTYGSQYIEEMQRISGLPKAAVPVLPLYQGVWSGPNVFYRLQQVVPSQVGYGYGEYAAAPLVSFLPGEQAWAADSIKRILEDRFVGLGEPATLLGSFYLDFGYVGIALGMALAGFALTALYRRLRTRCDLFATILYSHASFLAFLSLYGDLYNGNPLLLWNGALAWIVCRYAARRDTASP